MLSFLHPRIWVLKTLESRCPHPSGYSKKISLIYAQTTHLYYNITHILHIYIYIYSIYIIYIIYILLFNIYIIYIYILYIYVYIYIYIYNIYFRRFEVIPLDKTQRARYLGRIAVRSLNIFSIKHILRSAFDQIWHTQDWS